jgi:hypothetical protein
MPFNNKNNTVSYYDFDNPLPTLTKTQGNQIPDKAQILQLKGGNGGRLGEKSFKPQIIFAEGEVTDGGDAQTSKNINTYEFGSENDCGFAVKINEDVNNKSQVNIGYINSTSAINIYLSGNDLQFTKLISGSVETSTSFADGVTVKDFTVSTNGTSLISSVLDTDLGLNKYYFDMNDGTDCSKFLTATISDPNGATPAIKEPLTDLLNVYVVETDVNDAYLSYINANQEFIKGSSASVTIEDLKSFSTGNVVRIQESTVKYIIGTITGYNSVTGQLDINNISMPSGSSIGKLTLALGSFVTINEIYDPALQYIISHCVSITSTLEVNTNNLFKNLFGSRNTSGLRFVYQKEKTNIIPESKNLFSIYSDSFLSSYKEVSDPRFFFPGIPFVNFTTDRITQRDYIRSQYSGAKSVLIRKNKFSIVFNGFYSGGRDNTSNYFNGSYGNVIGGRPDVNLLKNNNDVKILIGNSAKLNANGSYSPYFTMKLYEVLVYKNIANLRSGNPQRIICDYLVSKYKNKAFFDSSEIQTDAPIYYSLSDRPNILGKVQKIITP